MTTSVEPDRQDLVFAAVRAVDPVTLTRVNEARSIADETRICLDRLQRKLEPSGCTLHDIVKANCYLAADSDRVEFWKTWDEIFVGVTTRIVRLTQVVGLADGCRVQLDVVAVRPEATIKGRG